MKKWYFLSPLILQKLIWIPTRIVLKYFGKFEVRGLENLKGIKGNVIFACNHASELDPILLPASIPFWSHLSPMFYVSREKRFYGDSGILQYIYGGWLFRIWGAYQVFVGLRDYEKALVNQIKIVNDGGTICIFPEGGTTPNGIIQPAKGGVAYLATVTNTPVVPVYLDGVFRLSIKGFFQKKKKLIVTYGVPIYLNIDKNTAPIEEYKVQSQMIMNKIQDMV